MDREFLDPATTLFHMLRSLDNHIHSPKVVQEGLGCVLLMLQEMSELLLFFIFGWCHSKSLLHEGVWVFVSRERGMEEGQEWCCSA